MIRRLVLVLALAVGMLLVSAGTASASKIACIGHAKPLHLGICIDL